MRGRFPLSLAWLWGLGGACVTVGVVWTVLWARQPRSPPAITDSFQPARQFDRGRRLTAWWDDPPINVRISTMPSGQESNIHPSDYVGPESCKECHPTNYKSWSVHPHRWMNALAGKSTVKGDFSGETVMSYLGGRAVFQLQ